MAAPADTTDAVTFAEFARLAGFRRSYVTQLRKDGRLVLNDQGRILVEQTQERIKATADPSKSGVAQRHAAQRQTQPGQGAADGAIDDADDAPVMTAQTENSVNYQQARARKEHYQALAAQRDYEISMGQLLNADDVREAVLGAITTLRSRLESLPDTLAPQITVISDEGKARALLADNISHTLEETARQFARLNDSEGQ